jgi:hypothetical protein
VPIPLGELLNKKTTRSEDADRYLRQYRVKIYWDDGLQEELPNRGNQFSISIIKIVEKMHRLDSE